MTRAVMATGRQGSGKTYRLAAVAEQMLREHPDTVLLALDIGRVGQGDFPAAPLSRRWGEQGALTVDIDGARAAAKRGYRVVVMRSAALENSERPTQALASELATLAAEIDREVLLAIPEAHLAARNGWPLSAGLLHVAHRARHIRVTMLADTQHPAQVHTAFRNEARWYVHATTSPRDVEAILDHAKATLPLKAPDGADFDAKTVKMGDIKAARERNVLQVHHALLDIDARGEPGWHIVLDGSRSVLTPTRE